MLAEKKLPPLDLRQLQYFVALAEHGSIGSAAAFLGLAQPSLSENVARLERQLDVRLTIRSVRGVQLTEAGFALAQRCREIVRSAADAFEEIRGIGLEPRGPVLVGLPHALSLVLTVPLAETIQNEHPQVRLHLVETASGNILEMINDDRLDIGCVYDFVDNAQVVARPLLTEELFLVTAPDNWDGKIGSDGCAVDRVDAAKLAKLPLVLSGPAHSGRRVIERYARAKGIQLNVVTEIDSLPRVIEMVQRASAYAVLPRAGVMKQVEEGLLALVPMEEPSIVRTAYLVRKRSKPVTCASLRVESAIEIIVRELIDRRRFNASLLRDAPSHKPLQTATSVNLVSSGT